MDWSIIIVAALAALPGTLLGITTLIQGVRAHKAVNSKMTKLLDITEKSAYAEGVKDGKESKPKDVQIVP